MKLPHSNAAQAVSLWLSVAPSAHDNRLASRCARFVVGKFATS